MLTWLALLPRIHGELLGCELHVCGLGKQQPQALSHASSVAPHGVLMT
jgi:hypothetical protein